MKDLLKKLLLFALYFLAFSAVLNLLFLCLIAFTDWDFIKRRESLSFKNPDFKVLVLGASLSEYDFDTELMTASGMKAFNLALVGSSVKTNYVQLSEYLSKYPIKPEIVILGVNSCIEKFHQDGIQPVVEFTMKGHRYGIKDIPITKFNWAAMELLKKAVLSEYRQTEVRYGHKRSIRIIPDNSVSDTAELYLPKFESAYWINKLATLCAQNGVQFVVIDLPGINATQNLSPLGPYTIVYPDGSKALLYNMNSREFCSFIDSNRDWAGLSHFNQYGAEKFTGKMMEVMFGDSLLSKHTGYR